MIKPARKRTTIRSAKSNPKALVNPLTDIMALELASIRQSLDLLRAGFGFDGAPRPSVSEEKRLGVFITRGQTPAKPYTVQCDGALSSTFKLSPIRAAIFLVLMVDLEDRLDGGRGVEEPLSSIVKTLRALEPGADTDNDSDTDAESPDRIRVAVYRFWEFCQSTNHFRGVDLELTFDDKRLRLAAQAPGGGEVRGLKLEITSNEPLLSRSV